MVVSIGILIILFAVIMIRVMNNSQKKREDAHRNYLKSMTTGLEQVKVLGTRTGSETVSESLTVNSTIYSLLLIYADGSKQTLEVKQDDMHFFSNYIAG